MFCRELFVRPKSLVAIAGTGTEIGKTWAGARLLTAAQAAGLTVAARKPAQSFDPADPHPTDAEVLGGASGELPGDVCPSHRWYGTPLAPPMAAAALGLPAFTVAELVSELVWPDTVGMSTVDLGLVEGAGAVRSPLADDGDFLDYLALVRPNVVVLVADAQLGTINNIRLCLGALAGYPTVVLLNRFDESVELHRLNRSWLTDRDGFDVITDIADLVPRLTTSEFRVRP
jgi:dethiobiotin synthetase